MVQGDSLNGTLEGPAAAQGIPDGCYRLIGWAVDTTGGRLIDEICQIAAYTPTSQFSQYIMPYRDINPTYIRRHMIRVINYGRYRMLKDLKKNKFIKTKSAVLALTDFIAWLEKNRGDATDGVILIYHEFRKSSPAMLLETLRHYNLLDRFQSIVKGFANGFNVAQEKCSTTTKSYSLRMLSRILLNKEEDFSNAVDRARSGYEVVVHLGQGERPDLDAKGSGDCTGVETHLVEFVRPYTNLVEVEEAEIADLKVLLKRQNTFRPVFGDLLKATRIERQHASRLRRLLVENNIDYDKLKAAYDGEAKCGIEKLLKNEVQTANEKEQVELLEILDCFFDPEKKPVQPKPRVYSDERPRKPRFNKKGRSENRNTSNESASDTAKVEENTTVTVPTTEDETAIVAH